MRTPLNHDNRNEPAYRDRYTNGRQPWSYMAIIRWARANGYPYRWQERCLIVNDMPTRTAHSINYRAHYGSKLPA